MGNQLVITAIITMTTIYSIIGMLVFGFAIGFGIAHLLMLKASVYNKIVTILIFIPLIIILSALWIMVLPALYGYTIHKRNEEKQKLDDTINKITEYINNNKFEKKVKEKTESKILAHYKDFN